MADPIDAAALKAGNRLPVILSVCLLTLALYLHVVHLEWFEVHGSRRSTTIIFVWLAAGAGGLASFAVLPRIIQGMGSTGRKTLSWIIGAFALCSVFAGAMVVVRFVQRAQGVACVLGAPTPRATKTALGDAPHDLGAFVPTLPFDPRPTAEELEGLEGFTTQTQDGRQWAMYQVPGFTVRHRVDEAGAWGPPTLTAPGLTEAQVTRRWGPRTQLAWKADGLLILPGAHRQGECSSTSLRIERRRDAEAIVGPNAAQPLSDFAGTLVGKTPEELGLPEAALSKRTSARKQIFDVPIEGGTLSLHLNTDRQVSGWQLLFESDAQASLALLEQRLGRGSEATPKTKGETRRRSTKDWSLAYGELWSGAVFVEYATFDDS